MGPNEVMDKGEMKIVTNCQYHHKVENKHYISLMEAHNFVSGVISQ